MPLHRLLKIRFLEVRDDEDLLHGRAATGHQLVAAPDGRGHPHLKGGAATFDPVDDGRCDRLNALLGRQRPQPGDQPLEVGAVGDHNPAQIRTKSLVLIEVSGHSYVMESASPR